MMGSLFGLILLVALAWYWQNSLKVRELGIAAARQACAAEGFQFLDETVAQSGIRLVRGERGHMQIQRSFAFEYSCTGDDRQPGSVTLLGDVVIMLFIGHARSEETSLLLH
jgi:hypothetical protein